MSLSFINMIGEQIFIKIQKRLDNITINMNEVTRQLQLLSDKFKLYNHNNVILMTDSIPDVLKVIFQDIHSIIKDGKVNMEDAPVLLNIFLKVFNHLQTKKVPFKIEANTLIELGGLVLKILFIYLTSNDPNTTQIALDLVNNTILLVQFQMKPKSYSLNCCF